MIYGHISCFMRMRNVTIVTVLAHKENGGGVSEKDGGSLSERGASGDRYEAAK